MGTRTVTSLAVLAYALAFEPTAAIAQEEAAPASGLGDIVVTAQRRVENVQDIGAAISAVDNVALQTLGVKAVGDLIITTPSLKVNTPFGEGNIPQFAIRGVTMGSFNLNQSRPIALYVNESIRSLGVLEVMPIYDVDRVEVLKGPQGSLYGLNAVGGAINIITQRPGFDTSGYLTVGYGNYDRREARGAAQTALIDDVLAVRAAFTAVKADGMVRNLFPGGQDRQNLDLFSARVSLRFKPSNRFDSTLTLMRTTTDNDGYTGYPVNFVNGINPVTGASRAGLGYYEEKAQLNSFGRTRNTSLNLRMSYEMDFATLSSITSYDTASYVSRNDDDFSEIDATDINYAFTGIKQFYQELRLQSQDSGDLKWMVGASYLRDVGNLSHRYFFFNDPILQGNPNTPTFNQGNTGRHRHRNIAAYARLDYNVDDVFHVFGGVRYQKDTVGFLNYHSYADFVPGVLSSVVPALEGLDQKATAKKASFEVGGDFKPVDGMLVYASFKQGFRGPAANAQLFNGIGDANVARPERIDAYEAGVKWDITRAIRFNASVFRYDYKDQQYLNNVGGANGFGFTIVNAGSSRINGAEVEIKIAPIEALVLTGSGTFLDPKYRDLELSRVVNGALTPFDLAGNQIVYAPKTSLSFAADLTLGETAGGKVSLHGDTTYQSRIYFDAYNTRQISDNGRWLVNGRLTWAADDSGITAGLWVQNLLKERYFTFGYDSSYYGIVYGNRGQPRTFGADLTYSF